MKEKLFFYKNFSGVNPEGEILMKKLLTFFVALSACVTLFAFAGCNNNTDSDGNWEDYLTKTQINGNKSIVFTPSSQVTNIGYSTSVADYLNALKAKSYLAFESNTGDFGLFITSMDGTPNVDNGNLTGSSWMLYIDFLTLEGDGAIYGSDFSTVVYEGKTLYSSNNGVSGTPCVEGHTYAFVYEAYDYSAWN